MPGWKKWLCRQIFKLDRIPRYGRYYTYNGETKEVSPAKWMYEKYGLWGFNFLDNIGWLHDYIDEIFIFPRPPRGYKHYYIDKSADWRSTLKLRRELGIWDLVPRHNRTRSSIRRHVS